MSNDKYISVKDLENLKHRTVHHNDVVVDWYDIQQLINNAETMISVRDIKEKIKYYDANLEMSGKNIIDDLKMLIDIPLEKYASLTEDNWIALAKQPYVLIELYNADESVYFLDDLVGQSGEFEDIKQLLRDPSNMARTDIDIPGGIKVQITDSNGRTNTTVTPFSPYDMSAFSHYIILGV